MVLRTKKEQACLVSQARQEEETSRERRRRRWLARRVKGRSDQETTPLSCAPPLPQSKAPHPMREVAQMLEEVIGRVEEASRLAEAGWSPSSLPTRQLVQMAVEAGPSALEEEPARRKLCPTIGGKAPWKEFLKAGKVKKTRKYWPGTVPFVRSGGIRRALNS